MENLSRPISLKTCKSAKYKGWKDKGHGTPLVEGDLDFMDAPARKVHYPCTQEEMHQWLLNQKVLVMVNFIEERGDFYWKVYVNGKQIKSRCIVGYNSYPKAMEAGLQKGIRQIKKN